MAENGDNGGMKRHGELTRGHILAAAERVFSEKGYDRATIKEITSAAGSNIASINYHLAIRTTCI